MSVTGLVLGTDWSVDEWPDLVVAAHQCGNRTRRYVPERTCRRVNDYCTECGSYFLSGSNYCSECGAKVVG